jgi:hypothetical protein
MYVCIYVCMYVCMHVCVYVYMHMHVFNTYIHTYIITYMHTYKHTPNMHTNLPPRTAYSTKICVFYTYIHTCITKICVFYTYIHTCIHTYTQTYLRRSLIQPKYACVRLPPRDGCTDFNRYVLSKCNGSCFRIL